MKQNIVIQLQNISKRFGHHAAVDGVSLSLKEGEFYALLGPSGCGKTTLLRLIAGFETPNAGHVLLDGQDMTNRRPNSRPVNMMFQSYALFPHMSVRANIAYGLEMEKLSRSQVKQRVDTILDMTELTEFSQRKPNQLSGGQQQRVALARALVKKPRVLLLDEPLGALDKQLRSQMQLELKRFQHELGITFVVVTHDQEEALVMADRVALMNHGQIVQEDNPRQLYERPNSRFAAQFIGVTNLFEGSATGSGVKHKALGEFAVNNTDLEDLPLSGNDCALSVRPERMRISLHENGQEHPVTHNAATNMPINKLAGVVSDLAYHGQDMNIIVSVRGLTKPVIVRIDANDALVSELTTGQSVWCYWQSSQGRLLTA